MQIKKLTIDRRKWLRGPEGDSYLLRGVDGKMCCLGFLGKACGISDAVMRDRDTPAALSAISVRKFPEGFTVIKDVQEERENTDACDKLISINDGSWGVEVNSEKDREEKLKTEFKKLGIEVEFKN